MIVIMDFVNMLGVKAVYIIVSQLLYSNITGTNLTVSSCWVDVEKLFCVMVVLRELLLVVVVVLAVV